MYRLNESRNMRETVPQALPAILLQTVKSDGFAGIMPDVSHFSFSFQDNPVLVSSNVTMQFGSKPLFENISVKFGGGNRYGLIGANGSGKSTFMKILGGDLEPTLGNVSLDPNERIGKLRQDQFAFEEFTVLDTVIMGHGELWEVKQERDRIYSRRK